MADRILDHDTVPARLDDVRIYDGVLTRRVLAFLVDYLIVLLLLIPFAILVVLLGLLTFGLGWSLWREQRAVAVEPVTSTVDARLDPAGAR